jgi:hypothetical protein
MDSCAPMLQDSLLISTSNPLENNIATFQNTGRKRGPVTKRRFQKGTFIKDANGSTYVKYYVDELGPDGTATKQVKKFIGNIDQMSERTARREHARLMEDVNFKRGSVAPPPKGQSFVANGGRRSDPISLLLPCASAKVISVRTSYPNSNTTCCRRLEFTSSSNLQPT